MDRLHIKHKGKRGAAALAWLLILCSFMLAGCRKGNEPPAEPTPAPSEEFYDATPEPTATPVPWREGELIYERYAGSGRVRANGLGADPLSFVNPIQYINPRAVGLMVIDGILKNKPHISTHMYPMKAVLNRFNGILDAVPDYSEIKKRLDELDAQGAKF